MKFAFYTLGCKTNQYETQAMEQLLLQKGHEIGSFGEACDGYIINTCSVTAVADKKNRAVIRRCRRAHPQAIVAVCGCYSQHDPQAAQKLGVDVIGGSAKRLEFVELLLTAAAQASANGDKANICRGGACPSRPATAIERLDDCISAALPPYSTTQSPSDNGRGKPLPCNSNVMVDNALKRREFEILPAGGLEERTRAMLKVQDGCVNFCSYCIIPYTRGPIRSAPLALAVEQAEALAARGYREIVLTGIEIASWGADLPGRPGLELLIGAICAAVPQVRIRLGSLEPRIITAEFCKNMALFSNLCPQFHLSLQSGCDTVLARMKRKYDTARYYESVRLLREYFPGCAVTTDMIVAFPGETEEEFRQSLSFIRRCGFADMHIFPYSRRPGTPADKMPGQHDNATKEARSRAAIAVAEEMCCAYRQNLMGQTLQVLFEEPEDGLYAGHAPNYIKVYVRGEDLHNQIRDVQITGLCRDGVSGELV